MSALTDHIAQQKARGQKLTMWALCPVRGCLSSAPVGQLCDLCQESAALDRDRVAEWQAEVIRGICS